MLRGIVDPEDARIRFSVRQFFADLEIFAYRALECPIFAIQENAASRYGYRDQERNQTAFPPKCLSSDINRQPKVRKAEMRCVSGAKIN
jgi:hypothetical protein